MAESKKRVITLFRVSSKKQLKDEDIPVQQAACQRLIRQHSDWEVIDEKYEKGISGFKVSAENRGIIQDLKIAAINKEFDVLVVFKLDRLGRIADESPQVLRWFLSNDIDVWSTVEGQHHNTHMDKMIHNFTF